MFLDNFKKLNLLFLLFCVLFFSMFSFSFATQNSVLVKINEFSTQNMTFNPNSGWRNNLNLNNSGLIEILNINPSGENLSDVYVYLDNASLISNFSLVSGEFANVTKISNNEYLIHIPELLNGNFSLLNYTISNFVVSPLKFNTTYTKNKLFVGDNLSVSDFVENTFNNLSSQNSCIYNISVVESLIPIGNSSFDTFSYVPATLGGTDSGNVVFSGSNKILNWTVNSNACLNKGSILDINYNVTAPTFIPTSGKYNFSNVVLTYNMNETFSNLRVKDILAISSGNLTINKKIVAPSDPILYGTNVTWQVNGSFVNPTSLNYLLETSSFWVSKRNVDGLYTNISKIDVDGISGASLKLNLTPNLIVNSSNPFFSSNWFFNYSDVPSPITWMSVNFTLANDGVQILNKSFSKSNNSFYSKEVALVSGYFLEIEKNVTSIGNNLYNVKINVKNRGTQATPVGSVVTLYDYLPGNFSQVSSFSYSPSTWFNVVNNSNLVSGGQFNGKLIKWGIVPTNYLNVSFNKGPINNSNNSLSISYNISGSGNYKFTDVFVVGLDPEKVNGAGSSKAIIFKDIYSKIAGFKEYYFMVFGSIILSLILLV